MAKQHLATLLAMMVVITGQLIAAEEQAPANRPIQNMAD